MKTLPLKFHVDHVAVSVVIALTGRQDTEFVLQEMITDCRVVAWIFKKEEEDILQQVKVRVDQLKAEVVSIPDPR